MTETPASPTAMAPGTRLEHGGRVYEIGEAIGHGGFGETHAATRVGDDAALVVKALRLDRLADFKALELFEREAKVLAALEHPGIPRTLDFFAWDGTRAYAPDDVASLPEGATLRWIMVQSRAPGRSLQAMIEAGERLSSEALDNLLRALLGILDHLHGMSPPVVHRDIKPANIVLGDAGEVSLVDFGAISDRVRSTSTVASTSVGTFGYIPMEQMMGQARPASDFFALAMSVVVAATHRGPEQLPLDEQSGKVDLDRLAQTWPPGLRAALDAMLEPIVGRRAGDAASVLALLEGRSALAKAEPGALASRRGASLFNGAIGFGGVAAGLIYLVFFNSLSETALIQISLFWVAPVVFGVAGKMALARGHANPVGRALVTTALGIAALIVFIFAIFPSL